MAAMSPDQSRRLREMIILFTLFVVPGLISPGTVSGPMERVATMLALIVRNGGFVLLVLYLTDLSGDTAGMLQRPSALAPKVLGIAIGLFFLSMAVGFLADIAGVSGRSTPFAGVGTAHSPLMWVVLLLMLFVAALMEEVFFRGYLLLRLQQLTGSPGRSVIAAALLFSLGHSYQGLSALVFSFASGLFLGILWQRKPDILAFSLGHGLYNVAAVLLAGL